MNERILNSLKSERQSESLLQLLEKGKKSIKSSRAAVSKCYDQWDRNQRTYETKRQVDQNDRKSSNNNEPKKQTLPLSYAQIDAFVTIGMDVLFQRPRFFELKGVDELDAKLTEVSEILLENDLKRAKSRTYVRNFLLNLARFGRAPIRTSWKTEKRNVLIQNTGVDDFGNEVQEDPTYQLVTDFEGNDMQALNPYKFFPDPRVPLSRLHEGDFCGYEKEYTKIRLQELEVSGYVAGIEHIEALTSRDVQLRGDSRFGTIDPNNLNTSINNICVVEMDFKLVPKEVILDDGEPLGPERFPVMYTMAYANDSRIVRLVPTSTYHEGFSFDCGQFIPDELATDERSIAELLTELQEVADWYLNARIEAVKQFLINRKIVNPRYVDLNSLKDRNSDVYLSTNAPPNISINSVVAPMPFQDVTANHFNELATVEGLMGKTTGIPDPSVGQTQKGRRSAFEMRAVVRGGASRTLNIVGTAFEMALEPSAHKALMNHRQAVSQDTFFKVTGMPSEDKIQEKLELFKAFKASAVSMIGGRDYFVHEGVLPTEKEFMAQSLQELLQIIITAPQINTMSLSPEKILAEIFRLRGINTLGQFKLSPEEQQEIQRQLALQNAQQQVRPGESQLQPVGSPPSIAS